MRIALLHPTYWPEVRRGSERLVHDAAVGLAERGHDVTVLTSHRGMRRVTVEEGVRVVRSARPPTRLMHRRAYEFHLTHVPAVVRELARGRYGVAHAFFLVDAWAALQARRLGGPPVILSFHGIPTREFLVARRYRLPMLQRVAAEAGAVTVLSEAAREPFARYLLRDPVVVPGGVRVGDFGVQAERAPAPTLLCAASLNDPRKRAGLLFAAFERLRRDRPEARLLLAGRPDFTMGAMTERPGEGVEWIDADETPALARAYATSWASVLPAVHEAFGLVLVESLAAGTPVVAARSGACPEIVTGEPLGSLFEPDDEEGLVRAADRALELAGEPGTAEACRARAGEYDWSRVLPRYLDLYEAAREGATARPAAPADPVGSRS